MGNCESSSSQLPYHWNNSESDQSKKENEEEISGARSALEVGATIVGTALLAYGAWKLLAPSYSTDKQSDQSKRENEEKISGTSSALEVGIAVARTAFIAYDAWKLLEPSYSQIVGVNDRPGHKPESYTGDYGYQSSTSRSIKVMSYNVLFLEDVAVIKMMEAIGQLIQKHSPDIIFFQEVTPNIYRIFQSSRWWKLYKCSVPLERATTRYFGMLLSKLPVKGFLNKKFEKTNMGREVCFALLDVGSNNSLVVASSHFESPTPPEMNRSKRIAQAKDSLSHLSNFPNVVFGGDMNWDENSDGPFPLYGDWIDAWTELRPVKNGWTYDTKDNKSLGDYRPLQKRLDRFLCRLRDFELSDIQMIGMEAIPGLSYRHGNKVNPVYPSDHFGLLLTISAL